MKFQNLVSKTNKMLFSLLKLMGEVGEDPQMTVVA